MFRGAVSFAGNCTNCDLDYSQFNVGDGPAAFLIFIVGGIVMLCAILMELNVHPPMWVHMILWLPLTVVLTIGFLRLAKGALLVLEFKNKAREGRLDQ